MLGVFNNEYFRYEVVKNGISTPLNCVTKATIEYDSKAALKQSASIDVTQAIYEESLNIRDRIRIIHVLNGVETLLATLLMSTPRKVMTPLQKDYTIDCYSTLWLISKDKVEEKYFVPKGTQVVAEIRRIIGALGYSIQLTDSIASTNVDIEFNIGTPYLTIINELLKVINYTSLFVDTEGTYMARPYLNPQDREVDFEYSEDDVNDYLDDTCTYEHDVFDVPNVFIRYVNNPNVSLRAVYTNDNPQSMTSTVYMPRNVSCEEVRDAADMQTLFDICKKECMEASSIASVVEIKTAINPTHSFENCIGLKLNGINSKFIENKFTIECETGEDMTHYLEEVVYV